MRKIRDFPHSYPWIFTFDPNSQISPLILFNKILPMCNVSKGGKSYIHSGFFFFPQDSLSLLMTPIPHKQTRSLGVPMATLP